MKKNENNQKRFSTGANLRIFYHPFDIFVIFSLHYYVPFNDVKVNVLTRTTKVVYLF